MAANRQIDETGLSNSSELFRVFIENAPIAIGISKAGKNIYGNIAYQAMFGANSMQDIIGKSITDQVAPSCRSMAAKHFKNHATSGLVAEKFEATAVRLDGSQFHCIVDTTMLDLPDGAATLAFYQDISAQKDAQLKLVESESKLRNLAAHLLHAREEERKTVAREIHDELGQNLTALKMDLQWIEKRLDLSKEPIMDKFHNILELVSNTIQMVHRISSELRPVILDDLGLAAAFEWLGGDFAKRNGIPCQINIASPIPRITGRSAIALYRIVQEALINIAHHAKASKASVELRAADHAMSICVRDDGLGITVAQSTASNSFGLIGIRERVQGLHGELSIQGCPGEGTTLMVIIPLPEEGGLS